MRDQLRFCVLRGGWRFVLRRRGRTRVIGPSCAGPIQAWNAWDDYRRGAMPGGGR